MSRTSDQGHEWYITVLGKISRMCRQLYRLTMYRHRLQEFVAIFARSDKNLPYSTQRDPAFPFIGGEQDYHCLFITAPLLHQMCFYPHEATSQAEWRVTRIKLLQQRRTDRLTIGGKSFGIHWYVPIFFCNCKSHLQFVKYFANTKSNVMMREIHGNERWSAKIPECSICFSPPATRLMDISSARKGKLL